MKTIEIILPILGLILFIWYARLKGYLQGYYYHNRHLTIENLHPYYFMEAIVFALIISIITVVDDTNLITFTLIRLLNIVSYGLIFPFIHDGNYYATRNNLNPNVYENRWLSEPESHNAVMDFSYDARLCMFIVGIVLYISINVINIIS